MQQRALTLLLAALSALMVVSGTGAVMAEPPKATDAFGAALTLEQPTPLATVLANPERYANQAVLIHGRLTDVCQNKGCWTVIQDGAAHVRVRFKDYGFFLPKDSTGREAFVEGRVAVETLTEEQAKHYESESRNGNPDAIKGPQRRNGNPDTIKGPQRRVGFTASGVRLVQR